MRLNKLVDKFKSTQVHAVNPDTTAGRNFGGGAGGAKLSKHYHRLLNNRLNASGSKPRNANFVSAAQAVHSYGLPSTNLLEPPLDPHLKPINFVESLADLYRRLEAYPQSNKTLLCIEQYSLLRSLGDPKLLRGCLRVARQHASDVQSKVVLSAWLRFERREDELVDVLAMDCSGYIVECPKAALLPGCDLDSIYDHCQCQKESKDVPKGISSQIIMGNECLGLEDSDICFRIGDEEISCVRSRIAALSSPLKVMLYGGFVESKGRKIDLSRNGISVKGMRAVEMYSRTGRLDLLCPEIVLELLSFANMFCCEQMKTACDAHLASIVCTSEDALILIEYGLQEMASLLVASCLQVLLRELPSSLYNLKVMKFFCSSEARERLALVGDASFLLYYFLSLVAMEESMVSNITVMLLRRLGECASGRWQKMLALHQLGCVMLERKEYKDAECCFQEAAGSGHLYSIAGVARAKYKQGQQFSAYKLMYSLISEHKLAGWMYQERSLYGVGREKITDLNTATELDPTLTFPYKYRAVAKMEGKRIKEAITEINKIIGFKLLPDCLELRAWFLIGLGDYENALRDIRALLTLEPNYMMLHGKLSGNRLVELLSHWDQQPSQADCWMQLYERWSSVDDIGSLAVIHQMLANDPGRSLIWFRQSLLLLRLNCQKAAMHSLRLARNYSSVEHERLVYEGWILYDTGYREEALSRAEKSISIQRSFEAFFLKAYILADTSLNPESSSCIIQLLEDALRCPSDGLRKGQALNNLGSIYVDCGKLDLAADCYMKAIDIKHTRAHQGLARVYYLKNQRKAAYDEMTKLIEKAQNIASAYEKRSEYGEREIANNDLSMATQLDPLRTYPYRYRAAVLMDDLRETEAVEMLTKAIAFKPDLQILHLRGAFYESLGNLESAILDFEAVLCLDPNHRDTLDLYSRAREQVTHQSQK